MATGDLRTKGPITNILAGHRINKAKYLFSLIPPEKEQQWRDMFGGTQAERKKIEEEAAKKAAKKVADKARKEEKKRQQKQQQASEQKPMEQRSVEATAIQGAPTADAADGPVNGVADG